MRRAVTTAAWIGALVLALAACAHPGSWPGPGAPRNGAGVLVDPVYGTPLPGGPPMF